MPGSIATELTDLLYGHAIYLDGNTWRYVDTHEPIQGNIRPCPQCNQLPTPDGHDACLGCIPGAKAACCGHGKRDGYVMWEDTTAQIRWAWEVTMFGYTFEFGISRPVREGEAASR